MLNGNHQNGGHDHGHNENSQYSTYIPEDRRNLSLLV